MFGKNSQFFPVVEFLRTKPGTSPHHPKQEFGEFPKGHREAKYTFVIFFPTLSCNPLRDAVTDSLLRIFLFSR